MPKRGANCVARSRVDRRSGQEFGGLHRHTRTHRYAVKGNARRAVEVVAGTKLVNARNDAGALAHPVGANQVPRTTQVSSKELNSALIVRVQLKVWRLHDDHPVPLHGDGLLQGPAPDSKRKVMGSKFRLISEVIEALYHNDQLVGPRAVRREAGHRVLGVIELVAVADEGQALGGLVWWLCGARKRGSEGKQSGNHEEPHREDSELFEARNWAPFETGCGSCCSVVSWGAESMQRVDLLNRRRAVESVVLAL